MKTDSHYQQPQGAAESFAPYAYTPFQQRLGAADQYVWQQTQPKNVGWYMTFWRGNQLPGVFMSSGYSPGQNWRYMEQHPVQRTGGAFGGGWMSAVSTFNFLERLRSAWASQSGYNG